MNSMPEMNPAILQTPGAESNLQDKYSPDKTEFASLVENECLKSTDCESQKKDIKSESAMKEDDGSKGDSSACNDFTTDINNAMYYTRGNNEKRETHDIESVNGDDENTDDEAGSEKGLKTEALLFSLVHGYMVETGNASQVLTGDGTSETAEIEGGFNPDQGSDQTTGLSGAESSDSPAGNGLKVGTLLNNMVSEYAAEIEEASDINYENAANIKVTGAESGEAGSDSHGENGLKIGELLNRPADRSDEKGINKDLIKEEMASSENKIDINAEADDSEADSLIFRKEIPAQAGTKNEVSMHVGKTYSEDRVVDVDIPETKVNSEGLNSRPMSGTSDQFKQENGTGEHAFNFAKGPHNPGNDAETNNINPINTSNTAYENARAVQSPSGLYSAKTPGVQELLDNVVYVIKGNSKMGVSVEHENLGKLNISLSLEKGLVNVHINTSDKLVRELLENNIQQMVDTLNKDGVSVGEFSVGLRDQREHETNKFSLRNGQGREIPQETKKEHRHSGLVNIFA